MRICKTRSFRSDHSSMAPLTLNDAKRTAESHGGECLSNVYVRTTAPLRWRCSKGHEWESTLVNVRTRGKWCRKCSAEKRKLSIEDAHNAASGFGGECLTESYTLASAKMRWRCANGHIWESPLSEVRRGRWCHICANRLKGAQLAMTLADMCKIAEMKGGACLSPVYVNQYTNLQWECSEGHQWEQPYAGIRNGYWCPECTGRRKQSYTIEERYQQAEALAKENNGEFISGTFEGYLATNLRWRCSLGHEWTTSLRRVADGNWCKVCTAARLQAQAKNANGLKHARQRAKTHGGECLSREYVNNGRKLHWRCAKGHEWESSFNSVVTKLSWCPQCKFVREGLCRRTFETLTGHKFPKKRPAWLMGLELDGYCEELGVAFEYHGKQHSEYVPHFHRNGEIDLANQQKRDALTIDLCEANWVHLIVIWHHDRDPIGTIRREVEKLDFPQDRAE